MTFTPRRRNKGSWTRREEEIQEAYAQGRYDESRVALEYMQVIQVMFPVPRVQSLLARIDAELDALEDL